MLDITVPHLPAFLLALVLYRPDIIQLEELVQQTEMVCALQELTARVEA